MDLLLKIIFISKNCLVFMKPPHGQTKFPKIYNVVIKIQTNLSLIGLFKIIKKIEKSVGRKKS